MYSALEITEKEFLIKLDRNKFSLNFIRTLLKIVEVAKPSDEDEPQGAGRYYPELNKSNTAEPEYFGSLEEK